MKRRGIHAPCAQCLGIDNTSSPKQLGIPWPCDQNPDTCDTAWPISAENPFRNIRLGVLGRAVPCGHGHGRVHRPIHPFLRSPGASLYLRSPGIRGQNAPFSDSHNTWSLPQTYSLSRDVPASSTCSKQHRLCNRAKCVLVCYICSKYRCPLLSALETGIWTWNA